MNTMVYTVSIENSGKVFPSRKEWNSKEKLIIFVLFRL